MSKTNSSKFQSLLRAIVTRRDQLKELDSWFAGVKTQRVSQTPGEAPKMVYHHEGKFISPQVLREKVEERKTLQHQIKDIQEKMNKLKKGEALVQKPRGNKDKARARSAENYKRTSSQPRCQKKLE